MVSEVIGYGLIFVVFLLISVIMFVFSFRQKNFSYKMLSLFSFLLIILYFGEFYIVFSPGMFEKLVGFAITNISYPIITVLVFVFSLHIAEKDNYIKFKYIFPLSIIPLISVVCGFINCYYPILEIITILPNGLILDNFTVLYNCIDLYLILLSVGMLVIILIQLFNDKKNWQRYTLFIIAGLIPTLVGFVSGAHEVYPIAYFFSLVFFLWAVLGYDLLDTSVVHKEFIDNANVGMVFFNEKRELVEANLHAKEEAGFSDKDVNKPVEKVFDYFPEFLEFFNTDDKEIILLSPKSHRWFKINKTKLFKNNRLMGSLFIFEDIHDEIIKTQSLEVFNSVVSDVESAARMAINYRDKDGKYHWSDVAYQILERDPRPEDVYIDIFTEVSLEESHESVEDIIKSLKGEKVTIRDFKIKTESGKIKYISGTLHKLYDKDGNFLRLNMSTQDVTESMEHELLITKSEHEKTVLLKEIHHRVKNNLQLMSSFINLEEKFHSNDPEETIKITKKRINALALIHERIYNEENMDYIRVSGFFKDFDNTLFVFSSYDDIEFIRDIPEDLTLKIDIVTPLTLMINELTLNSFKYAYDDTFTEKRIFKSLNVFEKDGETFCRFEYKDNGKGLPEGFDVDKSKTLGWTIIRSLSGQLDGEYEIISEDGLGFNLTFPIK